MCSILWNISIFVCVRGHIYKSPFQINELRKKLYCITNKYDKKNDKIKFGQDNLTNSHSFKHCFLFVLVFQY